MTPDLLEKIWQSHDLGPVQHMERPTRGSINPCWIVNDTHVIRFNTLSLKGAKRFASEKYAYELLRGSGVPVPDVIAFDPSLRLAPHPYLITSKLPGTNLRDSWPTLSEDAQKQIAIEAGKLLAQIHTHTLDRFGNLHDLLDGRGFRHWYDYVYDYFERYAQQAIALNGMDASLRERIARALRRHRRLLDTITTGVLVHSDYQYENILQQDGQITGIIDFEWALSGDPAWDFIARDRWDSMGPGSQQWVYRGYVNQRPLDIEHETQVALYRVLLYQESMVDALHAQDAIAYHEHRVALLDALARLS